MTSSERTAAYALLLNQTECHRGILWAASDAFDSHAVEVVRLGSSYYLSSQNA